jgi:hypothetical protein
MSLNNSRFSDFLHLIYPSEHKIKKYLRVPTVLLVSPTCSFIHTEASRRNKKNLVQSFNFTFRYTDDVFSSDFLHLIYPSEHKIKGATDTGKSASYIKMDS